MVISYKWLSDYLPVTIEPERLSRILTSIGLEVEDFRKYEEVKGGLQGLVVGEVLSTGKHPNADKLTLTTVNVGNGEALQIVCGAPNVATGQKVIVAKPGTTIFPVKGEPVTMKVAKIRGVESNGMICAEDEIGLGTSHAGIMVLPADTKPGMQAADFFQLYEDWIYEIGLTPNRMDAMSHWGVARDVCAYISHHEKKATRAKIPTTNNFKADNHGLPVQVIIENAESCQRYSGVSISNINSGPSPQWMQQRLKAIGIRPINNIVDITNYIQHETGQPLHAFDFEEIKGGKIIVKNLPQDTPFVTLDEKPRKLSSEDLMICDAQGGICIAGVFGGLHSGVTGKTRNVFLESAWFNPVDIRKTSFRHNLRTDAASRFEKNIDISNTVNVLKRAAMMIKEICGGEIASEIVDVYPDPKQKTQVAIKYHYLKKLSGKNYHPDTVASILESLGFEKIREGIDEMVIAVPYHKPDVSLPADIVEEIIRIDGLDNIEIPTSVNMTPSVDENFEAELLRNKVAAYLVSQGFYEILTNSITNNDYYDENELKNSVKMLNSLSADLNLMRPSMLETGLEALSYNLNRKNNDLKFFDFGKTYGTSAPGKYYETEHLCLYITGRKTQPGWKTKSEEADFYYLKGIVSSLISLCGLKDNMIQTLDHPKFASALEVKHHGAAIASFGIVSPKLLQRFSIKQPVVFADLNWNAFTVQSSRYRITVEEISRFPIVQRDLAMVIDSSLPYEEVEKTIKQLKLESLQSINLFDIFESDKLGKGRKSIAINFTFSDPAKTLTDEEIDGWMNRIMKTLEKEISAEIRK